MRLAILGGGAVVTEYHLLAARLCSRVEVAAIADRSDVLDVLRDRVAEGYQVTVDRCIGVGEDVVVSMRFSRVELDATDERPLQSRRSFLVGRYAAIVTMRDGHVARVVEYPHLAAALAAAGLEDENP